MSIQDKIKSAGKTTWVTDGLPEWKVKLWVKLAQVKAKIYRRFKI